MLDSPVTCPNCCAQHIVKNGRIHNGKQNFKGRTYGRQFVQNPENKIIDQNTKDLIDKLLLEKLPLAGIARVTGFPGFDGELSTCLRPERFG